MTRLRPALWLNALRAFEASARHGSFSLAAAELGVTPAAVGQMVRGLEDWLGLPLFHRQRRGSSRLIPTDTARTALPDLRAGLDHFASGLDRLRGAASTGILNVATSPAFAAKWLLPRIHRFQMTHPQIDIRLETSLGLADYAGQGIDLGIRYGSGEWPGLHAQPLMTEDVFQVAGKGYPLPATLQDLPDATLIHDRSVDPSLGFVTWDSWFAAAGIHCAPTAPRGLGINNSAAVLQAAIDGQGIALARGILAQEDLASGRLIRLFPEVTVPSPLAYHLVCRPDLHDLPKLVAFRDWLSAEVAAEVATPRRLLPE